MDKRYQVFVSSTYTDLEDARAEVMQALLELDCMPAGMELFPAANEEQWKWIKRVIDESDYYVVIIAGRYGSISKATGQSYTEMEYRYALEAGKPVIAFLHENPSLLPAKFCETTAEGGNKLAAFRALVEKRLCKHWSAPADLGAKVSRSLTQLIKQVPAIGWIRANAQSEESSKEVLALRRQVDELQSRLEQVAREGPPGAGNLSQGDEQFDVGFVVERKTPKQGKNEQTYWIKAEEVRATVNVSWDDIIARIAPRLIQPANEWVLLSALNGLVADRAYPLLGKKFKGSRFENFRIFTENYTTIKIQLRALGLIAAEGGNWVLTDYGDAYMNRLLAVLRAPSTIETKQGRRRRPLTSASTRRRAKAARADNAKR